MQKNIQDFINGQVYGWTQVVIMQPFDRIKVMMQNTVEKTGIMDSIKTIIKEEGVIGFYKGTGVLLIGYGALGSLRWGTFEQIKRQFKNIFNLQSTHLPIPHNLLAAFFTGCVSSYFVGPMEHLRTRMQIQRNQSGPKLYKGSLSAAYVIAKNHGISAVWKGQIATLIRESTGLATYLTIIEQLTVYMMPPGVQKKDAPIYIPIIAGGLGGTSYWVLNYPVDYIKTRMQSDSLENPQYKGFLDCWRQESKNGISKMYKGFTICMLRSFPVNGGGIAAYRFMQNLWDNESVH